MNKKKIALWAGLALIVVVVLYQNLHVFTASHAFRLNLLFAEYHSPPLSNLVLFLAFFMAGFLAAYFLNLSERYEAQKTQADQMERIAALEGAAGSKTGAARGSQSTASAPEAEPDKSPSEAQG